MKLKDIPDMSRYLEYDCYCPGEIYSTDGFFFLIFGEEDECEIIGETDDAVVVMVPRHSQVVYFYKEKDKTVDAVRFDSTKNNIELLVQILRDEYKGEGKFDLPDDTKLKKFLNACTYVAVG